MILSLKEENKFYRYYSEIVQKLFEHADEVR